MFIVVCRCTHSTQFMLSCCLLLNECEYRITVKVPSYLNGTFDLYNFREYGLHFVVASPQSTLILSLLPQLLTRPSLISLHS